MSHLDEAKTTMTSQEGLIRALIALGFTRNQIEIHAKAKDIIGYHNTEDGKVGHVIIRRQHTKIPSDIGWEMKDGNYVGHIDAHNYSSWEGHRGSTVYDKKWSVNLVRNYNIETTKMHFEAKGLTARVVTDAKGRTQVRAYSPVKAKQPLRISI
jgi:hypothetical protein